MRDPNETVMARWGAILLLALAVIVGCQIYAGEAERSTKQAACAQTKGMLANGAAASATKHPESEGDRGERSEQQYQAGREKLLVDAAARCAASAVLQDRGRAVLSTFVGSVGPFIGMMAFIVAGLRYDAGMRNAFGGALPTFDIEAAEGADCRLWSVRNVGLGPDILIGVRVVAWRKGGSNELPRSAFETFDRPRRVEVGEIVSFSSTASGDDLLVAVLSRSAEGRNVATWTRFRRVAAGDPYEKREDGRMLNV